MMSQPCQTRGDLPEAGLEAARRVGRVCWDIETSGLDWREESIATCQLYVPDGVVYIVQVRDDSQPNLRKLLEDEQVLKIFHHAMFDLRFMVHHWKVTP